MTKDNALRIAYEALRELAHHSAFADDAPEFNEGGVGYEARRAIEQARSYVATATAAGVAPELDSAAASCVL